MKSINLFALVLSLGMAQQATADTWQFNYTGFFNKQTYSFDPNYAISGSFSGTDSNHNNVIEFEELSGLSIYSDTGNLTCAGANTAYHSCGMWFSFNPGTRELYFRVLETGTDPEGWRNTYLSAEAGKEYTDAIFFPWQTRYYADYAWTDQTAFSVTGPGPATAPVPEPGTYAMLLAGLGVIGALARRKRA